MSNSVLQFFQAQIGKSVEGSPSPLGNWLNGTLTAVEAEEITVSFVVRKEMTNPLGTLHGGAAAAIIDEVIGMAVFALGKEAMYVTVSLTIDYLDNAREGETVFATAIVIRNGRTLVNVACQLTNTSGKILAKASSNLVAAPVKTT